MPYEGPQAGPLHLDWYAKKQCWQAGAEFYAPDPHWVFFGHFHTIAAADAAYRFAAGRADGELTTAYLDGHLVILAGGEVVARDQ